ncbi:unnamed protein product, partial [Heterosigma akashiwo]
MEGGILFGGRPGLLHILEYCDWHGRSATMRLNRWCAHTIWKENLTWKTMCVAMWEQERVYCNPDAPDMDWKEQFKQMLQVRQRWALITTNPAELAEMERTERRAFHVDVSVRFRPARNHLLETKDADEEPEPAVVVPLHQRLQLIRAQFGCSAAEAQQVLWGHVPP